MMHNSDEVWQFMGLSRKAVCKQIYMQIVGFYYKENVSL